MKLIITFILIVFFSNSLLANSYSFSENDEIVRTKTNTLVSEMNANLKLIASQFSIVKIFLNQSILSNYIVNKDNFNTFKENMNTLTKSIDSLKEPTIKMGKFYSSSFSEVTKELSDEASCSKGKSLLITNKEYFNDITLSLAEQNTQDITNICANHYKSVQMFYKIWLAGAYFRTAMIELFSKIYKVDSLVESEDGEYDLSNDVLAIQKGFIQAADTYHQIVNDQLLNVNLKEN